MSSFVVSPETMNMIVRTVHHAHKQGLGRRVYGGFAGVFADPGANLDIIGRKLFRMNIAATASRYPDLGNKMENLPGSIGAVDEGETFLFRGSLVPLSRSELFAGYKAMKLLRYQSLEGDIPNSEIFKQLERLMADIAEHLVEKSPEYAAAPQFY